MAYNYMLVKYLFLAVLTTVFIVVLFPFLFIYRKFVQLCARRDPKFGPILNDFSTFLADDPFPSYLLLVGVLKLDKSIKLSEIELILKRVLNMRLGHTEKLRYPELRQHAERFMGYWFWKNDRKFKLSNHIRNVNFDNLESVNIHQHLINSPLPQEQSPWDIIVLEDLNDNQASFVAFRVHHYMADGKSFVKLVVEGLCQKSVCASAATPSKNLLDSWTGLFCVPYKMIECTFRQLIYKHQSLCHPFRANTTDNSFVFVRHTQEFPLQLFKEAGVHYGNLRTSAIVNAAVYGACTKFLIKFFPDCPTPEKLPVGISLPKPGHPATLSNHMCVWFLENPTNFLAKETQVQAMNLQYTDLREKSFLPVGLGITFKIVNSIMEPFRKKVTYQGLVNVLLSNIAGEQQDIVLAEGKCLSFRMSLGLYRSSVGLAFLVFSYKNMISISFAARSTVLEKKLCDELLKILEEEILVLLKNK